MFHPRIARRFLLLAALVSLCVAFAPGAGVRAQQSSNTAPNPRETGINLYKQGNDREAIQALRLVVKQRKDDLEAWHYLGLALSRQGKTGDARKAHETAAKLGEKFLDRLLDSVPYESLATNVGPYKLLLAAAADSAEKYLALSSKPSRSKMEEWTARLDLLRDYAQISGIDDGGNTAFKVYKPAEVSPKARILTRPEPQYTEEARQHRVTGTVVLRAIMAFDGKIRGLRVVRGLPDGLTLAAITAARRIRFVPAMIDSKPVSQYVQIEYNFNLY